MRAQKMAVGPEPGFEGVRGDWRQRGEKENAVHPLPGAASPASRAARATVPPRFITSFTAASLNARANLRRSISPSAPSKP